MAAVATRSTVDARHRSSLPVLVAFLGLLSLLGSGCGSDAGPAAPAGSSPSSTTGPSSTNTADPSPADDGGEQAFEFVVTDVFTDSVSGGVVLVGRQLSGRLRPGDVVETYTVGPASRVTVLQIDRVTPAPLTRDVDQLFEGQAGNVEISGGVAEDYIQGQTIVPPV